MADDADSIRAELASVILERDTLRKRVELLEKALYSTLPASGTPYVPPSREHAEATKAERYRRATEALDQLAAEEAKNPEPEPVDGEWLPTPLRLRDPDELHQEARNQIAAIDSVANEILAKQPYPCDACGQGIVSPQTGPGRYVLYRRGKGVELPESVPIPTCGSCGEMAIDERTTRLITAIGRAWWWDRQG